MKPMSIAILGTPVSSGNRGVLALGASLVNLCATATDGAEVILMLGHRDNKAVPFRVCGQVRRVRVVNCRLSPKARLRDHLAWIVLAALAYRYLPLVSLRRTLARWTPWIGALETTAIVGDVRGGDSFSDIYGMRRFLDGFLMAWTVLLVKGSMVQFPQTYGPYQSFVARVLSRYLLKRSSVVIARDEKSRQVAQEMVGPTKEVWLCPDVAFSLEVIRPDRIDVDPPLGGPMPSGVIGVNINGLMYNGGYTQDNMFGLRLDYRGMLSALVTALLTYHPGELWLVPHTYGPPESVESDPEASRKVRAALPEAIRGRVRIVTGEYDCHQLKGLIGQCDFFIGSRMHACIAALSQGVPCVGIAYSRKFEGVFHTVGMGDWVVDGREATNEQAVGQVLELYRKRDDVRQELKVNADDAKSRLHDVFGRLFDRAARAEWEQQSPKRI
jgi:colanic acid/amylovoran biosynthesis protein